MPDNAAMTTTHDTIRAIQWQQDHLCLLDQRLLPAEETYLSYHDAAGVAQAIRDMVVRGAPAIGISAAYGLVLSARQHARLDPANRQARLAADIETLAASRPTAVNLFWALARMKACLACQPADPVAALLAEAQAIHAEDIAANHTMGELGASLIEDGSSVLTHCNTGSLATGGYGTALGVIRSAYARGKLTQVYADETRPWLQGARLTAWELLKDQIPVKLIGEGAAASLMRLVKPAWVIVGSDRIAANGDVANKIGTYSLAVLARQHGVKFMVVAPTSTVDMNIPEGDAIPIEYRSEQELLSIGGQSIAPAGAQAWNPVFDVTPAALIDAIVTERGIVKAPDRISMLAMMKNV